MTRWYLVLFLLIGAHVLPAQKIRYNCQGCTLSVEEKRKIEAVAKYEVAFYTRVFGAKKVPTIRMRFIGDHEQFMKTQKKSKSYARSETGYYSSSTGVCVYKHNEFLRTSFHEMSHAVYDAFSKSTPMWIDEGLGTYFGGAQVDSLFNVTVAPPPGKMESMSYYVSRNRFSITSLLTYSDKKFYRRHEYKNYTVSWGIVYYLVSQHRDIFDLILYNVNSGVDSVKAINDHYIGGVEQLEKDLVTYYQ